MMRRVVVRVLFLSCSVVLQVVLLLVGCGTQAGRGVEGPLAPGGLEAGPLVYAAARPSVVRLEAGLRSGAGLVVGPGEVLTAAHVVRDALRIEVSTAAGATSLRGRIVGLDEVLDLALVSVPGLEAPVLELPPAGRALPSPGLEVWSVGHPGGLGWSMARGIVSHVDAAGGVLLGDLAAEPGSSGGPVLAWRDGEGVEIIGLMSRVLPSRQGPWLSAIVPAPVMVGALARLRDGARVGLARAEDFVATVHNRSPLVHDVLMARRVDLEIPGADVLDHVHDRLEFAAFPVTHTFELRTSWRYFFAGAHTFRYRVVRLDGDALETLHEGPLRTFELTGERTSYVHKVEIDIDLPGPGDYAVMVETNERLSAVLPLQVAQKGAEAVAAEPVWPFEAEPLHHALVIAARIEESMPGGPVSVQGTFNTVRLPADPAARRVRFDSWTVWSGAFAGEHTFAHQLVDAAGQVVAEGPSGSFALATSRDAHAQLGRWEVELPSGGLYFLLVTTDGRITRAMPIWAQGE